MHTRQDGENLMFRKKKRTQNPNRVFRLETLEDRRMLAGELGLRADFYHAERSVFSADSVAVSTNPILSRTDPVVNFNWGTGSPDTGTVRTNNFAVRWSGQVQAIESGLYAFRTSTDDGIRLYVNNQLLVERWNNSSANATGTIELTAGQRYDVRLDYYDASGTAIAKLEWQRPNQCAFAVVPTEQLYPFSQPMTINRPGMYIGSWESAFDINQAAVTIDTSAAVTISRSSVRGVGDLIDAFDWDPSKIHDVTVRDTRGMGLTPPVAGVPRGRFLHVSRPVKVIAEYNQIENVMVGIATSGYAGSPNANYPIKIRHNQGRNMDGRFTLEGGGWNNGPTWGVDRYFSHFIQISGDTSLGGYGIPGVDISWNEIVNEPGLSAVEDNISIYQASGTQSKPILIHNNFIRGAYLGDPTVERQFTGSAIQIDSNGESPNQQTPETSTAFVDVAHNIVVGATIANAVGHNITIRNNRVVYSGTISDGSPIWSYATGISMFLYQLPGSGQYETLSTRYNLAAYDNVIGAWNQNQQYPEFRNDIDLSDIDALGAIDRSRMYDNVSLTSDPNAVITYQDEINEAARWPTKLAAAGKTVGPRYAMRHRATNAIQVENYDQMSGVENYESGIGYLETGDWVRFRDIDFGTGVNRFIVNASTPLANSSIQIRLGSPAGTLLGKMDFSATGGWSQFQTQTAALSSSISGRRDIYLVFSGSLNIDYFFFSNKAQRRTVNGNTSGTTTTKYITTGSSASQSIPALMIDSVITDSDWSGWFDQSFEQKKARRLR